MQQIQTLLAQIEQDVATVRRLLTAESKTEPLAVEVPTLKSSYSKREADKVKAQINAAFEAGLISYDKRRGMKMVVTKATVGWSPTGSL